MKKLDKSFYLNGDVCDTARKLLGKELVVSENGLPVSGMITETEAYAGITDRASHAYNNRRTKRTETMFAEGGVAYVYLCYGVHYLFNIVTNIRNVPDAVLIRSVFPIKGWSSIGFQADAKSGTGPGKVARILGIGKEHNSKSLTGSNLYIIDNDIHIPERFILCDKRVGVDYAGEDAERPWRFIIQPDYLKKILNYV
jgi:DNA-3-methyladenine glycosylase